MSYRENEIRAIEYSCPSINEVLAILNNLDGTEAERKEFENHLEGIRTINQQLRLEAFALAKEADELDEQVTSLEGDIEDYKKEIDDRIHELRVITADYEKQIDYFEDRIKDLELS